MAWYSGTFYCGHEGYINIIGPLKNREKMREYKFSGLCPACCREALLQSRNEQNAAARKAAARMELPPLEGSRKQVTWAETLRVEALTRLQAFIDNPRNVDLVVRRMTYEALTPIELNAGELPVIFQEIVQYLMKKQRQPTGLTTVSIRICATWSSFFPNIWNGRNGAALRKAAPIPALFPRIPLLPPMLRSTPASWKSGGMTARSWPFMRKTTDSGKLSGIWIMNGMEAAGTAG